MKLRVYFVRLGEIALPQRKHKEGTDPPAGRAGNHKVVSLPKLKNLKCYIIYLPKSISKIQPIINKSIVGSYFEIEGISTGVEIYFSCSSLTTFNAFLMWDEASMLL